MFESLAPPSGAALAALLAGLAEAELATGDLLDAAAAAERVVAWAHARQLAVIGELMRREAPAGLGPARGEVRVGEFVVTEVATALGVSETAAVQRVCLATDLSGRLPFLHDALEAGQLDYAKATALSQESRVLGECDAQAVVSALLPDAGWLTCGQLRSRAPRRVAAIDPAGAAERAAANRRTRGVHLGPERDGVAELGAFLRAEDAALGWSVIDTLARAILNHNNSDAADEADARTLDQVRADVFADLITGRSCAPTQSRDGAGGRVRRRVPPAVTLTLTIGWTTLLGTGTQPGEVGGLGPVDAGTARQAACQALRELSGGLAVQWLLTDETGRAIAATAPTRDPARLERYRALAATALGVDARDRTCRFPGCTRPAAGCDHDHTRPFPQGPTELTNLACLCRKHHRLKTHSRWRVTQHPGGRLKWTSPHGTSYTTHSGQWSEPQNPPEWLIEEEAAAAAVPDDPGRTPQQEAAWLAELTAHWAELDPDEIQATGPDLPATHWAESLCDWDEP